MWALRLGLLSVTFAGLTLFLVGYIIARWRDREAHVLALSKTDPLTAVLNRRAFMEILEVEFSKARRYTTPMSFVMVDLDHFKSVNDRYGHLAGDQVLRSAAGAIKASLRASDVVARYGGEEFALLLPNTDRRGAEEVAERCRRLMRDTPVIAGQSTIVTTASMGLATFPAEGIERIEDLIARADAALYRAKENGRDRVQVAS
jgi:diguanylate cyclase (GGDEF)-like protein